jgi:hypothetical protein
LQNGTEQGEMLAIAVAQNQFLREIRLSAVEVEVEAYDNGVGQLILTHPDASRFYSEPIERSQSKPKVHAPVLASVLVSTGTQSHLTLDNYVFYLNTTNLREHPRA